jgi:hypothetical protein
MTCTVGGVTSGYWAKGRFSIASPPANVITIESTVAKIGRSMKNRENMARVDAEVKGREETVGWAE